MVKIVFNVMLKTVPLVQKDLFSKQKITFAANHQLKIILDASNMKVVFLFLVTFQTVIIVSELILVSFVIKDIH